MPILEDFYQENRKKGVGLIGFTDFRKEDKDAIEKIKNHVSRLQISYPILIDTTTNVRRNYKADVLPASVLIDQTGKVLDYQVGIDGAEKIMNYVKDHLTVND